MAEWIDIRFCHDISMVNNNKRFNIGDIAKFCPDLGKMYFLPTIIAMRLLHNDQKAEILVCKN